MMRVSGRSVVVTGLGVLCPAGDSLDSLHRSLCEGRGVWRRRPAADGLPALTVAELADFAPADYLGAANFRPLDRASQLSASAARLALEDSGWTQERRAASEVGLVLGTMFGSLSTIAGFDRRGLTAGPNYVKPFQFANSVINAAAGQTAIWHDLRGVNATISGDTVSGIQALGYAADLILNGQAEAVLAGGAEELCAESLWGFWRRGALAADNDGAPRAVPWHRAREGFVASEAAVFLMLEDAGSARRRGAEVLAEIGGYATAYDPAAAGDEDAAASLVARVVTTALDGSGLSAREVGCIAASASGSPLGDRCEAQGLAAAAIAAPVTAVKAVLGEPLGAAGGLQTAALIAAMRHRRLPGVAGLDEPEPDLPVDATAATRDLEARHGLVHGRGLDGTSAALVVSVPRPGEGR